MELCIELQQCIAMLALSRPPEAQPRLFEFLRNYSVLSSQEEWGEYTMKVFLFHASAYGERSSTDIVHARSALIGFSTRITAFFSDKLISQCAPG